MIYTLMHSILYRCKKAFVLLAGAVLMSVFLIHAVQAEDFMVANNAAEDFTDYKLEELMDYEVTSVSRRPERAFTAEAALYVITQEDIRRSCATTLPELFRMVPGLQVARSKSDTWAISSRGFNGQYANKLLVLIDDRTVYSPLFAGVFWDMQDMILEDIERIEVIRGPGATLWGSNAVNGVINIITKKAQETKGSLVSTAWGTTGDGYTGLRYGGKLNENFSYRVYAKYSKLANIENTNTTGDPKYYSVGFRIDGKLTDMDMLTVVGGSVDSYERHKTNTFDNTDSAHFLLDPVSVAEHELRRHLENRYLLARWRHVFSECSNMTLQAYYNREQFKWTDGTGDSFYERDRFDTLDIDFQHTIGITQSNTLVWGIGYRYINSNLSDSSTTSFDPMKSRSNLFSAFVQDKIILVKNLLTLTIGSKYEHTYFTGNEYQPSARLCLTPNHQHSVWTSVSRAVRSPGFNEHDITLTMPLSPAGSHYPLAGQVKGNRDYRSEDLLAYEIGYRFAPLPILTVDIVGFYNTYDHLRTIEDTGLVEERGSSVFSSKVYNRMDGKNYGFELLATCQVLDWWKLQPAFTHLKMVLDPDSDSKDMQHELDEGINPKNRVSVRSLMDLSHTVELDITLYYTDALSGYSIKRHFEMDARIGWRPFKNLELSLIGQNLFHRNHNEFTNEISKGTMPPSEVRRSVYGRISWEF
ncbi:MAG: TonB-dependent receptor [Pseudomonadota bacterium]